MSPRWWIHLEVLGSLEVNISSESSCIWHQSVILLPISVTYWCIFSIGSLHSPVMNTSPVVKTTGSFSIRINQWYLTKIEMVSRHVYWDQEKNLVDENRSQNISWHCPDKILFRERKITLFFSCTDVRVNKRELVDHCRDGTKGVGGSL
jgi:hypothetical protein